MIPDLLQAGKRPQGIYDALRLKYEDFAGSRSALKRLCQRIRKTRGVRAQDVHIRVETDPGEVAQVDFGYVGLLYDPEAGVPRKAWVFVMVLGFSRKMFTRIVFDQTVPTWLQLHTEAFHYFGGVPRVLVPDNLKAAVVRAAFCVDRDALEIQKSYRELCRHYGCVVDPTPPYSPEKKGKVEAGVKYVKNNFFRGSDFADAPEAQRRLSKWLDTICNQRIHGTTGRKPEELYVQVEKAALLPLPQTPFSLVLWHQALVHPDNHFVYKRRPYSAPFPLIGQKVWLRIDEHLISVFHDDKLIDTHERKSKGVRSTKEAHLPKGRADHRHRSRPFWEHRASFLGDEVRDYVIAVFDSDQVVYQLRAVQSIVTHLEQFPIERARAACRRALHFGCFTYRGIKDILLAGLDLLPLPTATDTQKERSPSAPSSSCTSSPSCSHFSSPFASQEAQEQTPSKTPVFARSIASLFPDTEVSHDWN